VEEITFGRRYRAVEKIGSGGMADVYKAVDGVLGRTVAVKVLHARYASEPTFVARFRQEAQAAANLSHPNIVNMYDWGREGETYYIVMEYVHGTDLKSLVQNRGPVDPVKAAEYGAQVCAALSVAHGYDIIHRDIKPHNIVLTPDGTVKVMDFGIARAGNTTMTQTGSVLGTAQYISPEQAQGKNLGPASDLYSLGATLYELVTGRPPFEGDTPVATALMQVNTEPVPPRQIRASIPVALESVIMKAMRKDPNERYASANEMRDDLKRVAAGLPLAAGRASAYAAGAPDDETRVMPAVDSVGNGRPGGRPPVRPIPERRTSPWVWAGVAAVIVVLAIAAALILDLFPGKGVEVPSLIGLTQEQADAALADKGLNLGEVSMENSTETSAGIVMDQNPDAGTKVAEGASINVVISAGTQKTVIPDVVGETESAAIGLLRANDLEYNLTVDENSTAVEKGLVIRTGPAAGTEVPVGTRITLYVSLGIEQMKVPDVTGMTLARARDTLEGEGFEVKSDEAFHDTVAKGNVISQSPTGDVLVEAGATITLVVSKGPEAVEPETVVVPSVYGFEEADAHDALTDAGFVPRIIYVDVTNPDEDGKVVGQDPIGGASAAKGSEVEVSVGRLTTETGN